MRHNHHHGDQDAISRPHGRRGFHHHHHFHVDIRGGRHGVGHHRGHGPDGEAEGRGRRGGRPFDYGELRVLALALIAQAPRHGYELIKAIEDRLGGTYTPSPGVIYPTLSWLDDIGYAAPLQTEGSRKQYAITAEGEAFLTANAATVERLLGLTSVERGEGRDRGQVRKALHELRAALMASRESGEWNAEREAVVADQINAIIASLRPST